VIMCLEGHSNSKVRDVYCSAIIFVANANPYHHSKIPLFLRKMFTAKCLKCAPASLFDMDTPHGHAVSKSLVDAAVAMQR